MVLVMVSIGSFRTELARSTWDGVVQWNDCTYHCITERSFGHCQTSNVLAMVNKNNNTEIGNFSLTQAHNKYKYDYRRAAGT